MYLHVERSLMERRVVGSILHDGTIELFHVRASVPRLDKQGRGMYYPVCGMVNIKEPLLLIGKTSPCGAADLLTHYLNDHLAHV